VVGGREFLMSGLGVRRGLLEEDFLRGRRWHDEDVGIGNEVHKKVNSEAMIVCVTMEIDEPSEGPEKLVCQEQTLKCGCWELTGWVETNNEVGSVTVSVLRDIVARNVTNPSHLHLSS
jgi:hypothetical protein